MISSRAKRRNFVGALLMGAFGVIAAWRFYQSDFLFFAMVSLRDFMGAVLLHRREEPESESSLFECCLAYVSSALPLFYAGPDGTISPTIMGVANLLAIGGYALATLAMIDLGKSFGVAPARRGVFVVGGVYRYLRHPMYTGYSIAEVGFVVVVSSNVLLLPVSAFLYLLRAYIEDSFRSPFETSSTSI